MESSKNNSSLYVLVGILLVLVLILGGYIVYDKVLSSKKIVTDNNVNNITERDNSSETQSNQTNEKGDSDKQLDNNSTAQELSVRTYRFFGYNADSSPDMYTTLKLYSNNKYDFYINNCEGLDKYSGNYTENDTDIILTGSKEITLNKKNDGNTLDFNYSEIGACHNSGGSFSLESSILER